MQIYVSSGQNLQSNRMHRTSNMIHRNANTARVLPAPAPVVHCSGRQRPYRTPSLLKRDQSRLPATVSITGKACQHKAMPRLGIIPFFAYAWCNMQDTRSDEELMLAYKNGEVAAFEVLYRRYRQPLYRYLHHQCGNAAIAEELFQDIWMNLVRTRERYEVTALFKTFVYRLAHNRLIDHYRKQKHGLPSSYNEHEGLLNMESTANPLSPQRQVSAQQQMQALLAAIEALPEAQREAFLLKENSGLSVEQIAALTDVNTETAKSRIRYAMNKLKQAVDVDQHD